MKKMFYTVALSLFSFVFIMCSNSNIPVESHWTLCNLYTNSTEIAVPEDHTPAISFLKGGKIAGETGCNRLFGDFTIKDNSISFTNMGSTRMMCPQMEFENAYLTMLDNAASYLLKDDTLTLKDKEGNIIAVLKKISAGALEN